MKVPFTKVSLAYQLGEVDGTNPHFGLVVPFASIYKYFYFGIAQAYLQTLVHILFALCNFILHNFGAYPHKLGGKLLTPPPQQVDGALLIPG